MTLRLLIQSIEGKDDDLKNTLQLEVTGSKAGTLISSPIAGTNNKWDPMFKVDCSREDYLIFNLYRLKESKRRIIAKSVLNCFAFI